MALIVVDCEAPFGVGAPSVGDMTEFGAVDVNALQAGRVETFHGVDCSEDTFRQFREWLEPRSPVAFVSDNPAYDFQWINRTKYVTYRSEKWSGRLDSNQRPPAPKADFQLVSGRTTPIQEVSNRPIFIGKIVEYEVAAGCGRC